MTDQEKQEQEQEKEEIIVPIGELLNRIRFQLIDEAIVRKEFSDFAEVIPTYDGGLQLSREDLEYLAEWLELYQLSSEPRIKKGLITRGVESDIYLYESDARVDRRSSAYRYASSIVNVAVIMARVDGVLCDEECKRITGIVNGLQILGPGEKVALLARANYLMRFSVGDGGSEQAANFSMISINREKSIEKIVTLSGSSQKLLIEIAMDIAISDGVIAQSEIEFVQDIYRAVGYSARSAKFDIYEYARKQHVQIRLQKPSLPQIEAAVLELDDVLSDLLSDFEDFSYAIK